MNDDAASRDDISDPNADSPAPPETAFDPDPVEPAGDSTTGAHASTAVATDDGDGGGFDRPIDTDFPTAPAKGGLTAALVAVGAGLLGAAVVVAAFRGRDGGDLHWSVYSVGLAATVVLLGLAVLGAVAVGRRAGGAARGDLVTWPGVVGILAIIPMIEVGLGDKHQGDWRTYLYGGLITVLGALGYVVARRAAFVVVTILGLAILYIQVFSDTVKDSFDDKNPIVVFAVAAAVFVVVITIVGWVLASRAVTGVVVGAAGLVAVTASMAALLIERTFSELFGMLGTLGGSATADASSQSDSSSSFGFGSSGPSSNPADYTGEVATLLVVVAVLTLLWALAALVSDHSGFKVLAVALPAIAVPLGIAVLAVKHPSWWEAGLGVAGAVLVLGALFLARGKARRAAGM